MEDHKKKVVIMDSGVGGLSILRACAERLPMVEFVYCSDNANYPYGTKSEHEVISCVDRVIGGLLANYQPDLCVIACNTASTVALPHLRKTYSTPFVGVVPAIKPAAALTQNKKIGLLATPATIARAYVDELIADFAPDCEVTKVGTSALVDIAEQKIWQQPYHLRAVEPSLQAFAKAGVDTVVLGCTHFKLVEKELRAILKHVDHWIDSSASIAKRVATLLQKEEENPQRIEVQGFCVLTKKVESVAPLQQYLKSFGNFKMQTLTDS